MTYHQLCPHTAGLHQLVVNGENKTVFLMVTSLSSLYRAFWFVLGTIRPGCGTELVQILMRRSLFFSFPGRHSRNKPASLHPLCINNGPVQPIEQ